MVPLDEVDREEIAQGFKMPLFVPKKLNGKFAFPAYRLILENPVSNTNNTYRPSDRSTLLPFPRN
jgi:hypothetical protein